MIPSSAHEEADLLCNKVLAALAGAEMEGLRFGREAGLACPAGCGDCCTSDHPTDSLLSVLPGARWALENGLYEQVLAASEGPGEACVFHTNASAGHCLIYPIRPLVCRMFAFSGQRDKHGVPRYRSCRRMPPPLTSDGLCPPLLSELATRLGSLHPTLSEQRFPLNLAFLHAVEWLGLRLVTYRMEDAPDGLERVLL